MTDQATRSVLIPADAPQRVRLERVLRRAGWTPLPYDDAEDAETTLAKTPASAVLLQGPGRRASLAEFVKKVRRVCPEAFLLSVGVNQPEADTFLAEPCTPQDILNAIRAGEAVRRARSAERDLHVQLRASEQEARKLGRRLKEIEATCSQLQKWAKSVENLALRDELTGLHNRRHFLQAAEQQIERSRRENSRFAVAMIDIDHFKRFNDTYGHIAGDGLLKEFAGCLVENLRRMDTVARYGGEEFIILLPETRAEKDAAFNPTALIERLRAAIESHVFKNDSGDTGDHLTISAGVALYPDDANALRPLVGKVDARLYRAKSAGRNRICAADE